MRGLGNRSLDSSYHICDVDDHHARALRLNLGGDGVFSNHVDGGGSSLPNLRYTAKRRSTSSAIWAGDSMRLDLRPVDYQVRTGFVDNVTVFVRQVEITMAIRTNTDPSVA